jgi:hypothetical protein
MDLVGQKALNAGGAREKEGKSIHKECQGYALRSLFRFSSKRRAASALPASAECQN